MDVYTGVPVVLQKFFNISTMKLYITYINTVCYLTYTHTHKYTNTENLKVLVGGWRVEVGSFICILYHIESYTI